MDFYGGVLLSDMQLFLGKPNRPVSWAEFEKFWRVLSFPEMMQLRQETITFLYGYKKGDRCYAC